MPKKMALPTVKQASNFEGDLPLLSDPHAMNSCHGFLLGLGAAAIAQRLKK
jgi:hypothetical protein